MTETSPTTIIADALRSVAAKLQNTIAGDTIVSADMILEALLAVADEVEKGTEG